MNLFDTVFKTISAPFSAFFPKKYPYVENGVRYVAPAPAPQVYSSSNQVIRPQPPQALSPAMEINNIQKEMGLPLLTLTDKEAMLYLPKSRKALEEFRKNRQIDQVAYAKLNQGLAEQNQRVAQHNAIGENAYATEQLRRSNNANQVRAQHDAEEQPYLDWMNQMQNIQNKMTLAAPTIPIKFQ